MVAVAAALACAVATQTAEVSIAAPASAATDDFYRPPLHTATRPGTLVKTRPATMLLQIPGNPRPFPGQATTLMYTSTLQDGSPTVVTGTIIDPSAPWHGHGPRPTIVMAPGTVGQGDQCAPSKLVTLPVSINPTELTVGLNYEVLFADLLLSQGYQVIMTDYIGLGTAGIHTYVNRVEEAHAVLDAARAALAYTHQLPSSPIGFWG